MELQELLTFAGTALASVIGAVKYAGNKLEIYREQGRLEREADRAERMARDERMMRQMDELSKTNHVLVATNQELVEGQRVLLNEHSVKINNIENTVIVMAEKLDNRLNLKKGEQHGN